MVRGYVPCFLPNGAIELGCPLRRADGFGLGLQGGQAAYDIVDSVLAGYGEEQEEDSDKGMLMWKVLDSEIRGEG